MDLGSTTDSDVEMLFNLPGNKEINLPSEKKTKIRDLIDLNVVVDGSDVCVGHTIALVDGETMNYILSSTLTKESPLTFILNFIQSDLPGVPIPEPLTHTRSQLPQSGKNTGSILVRNINGHSTRIHIVKTVTKTYIWYHNPWGYDSDFSHLNGQYEKVTNTYENEPWFKNLGTSSEIDIEVHSIILDDKEAEFMVHGKNAIDFYSKNNLQYKDELKAWEDWGEMTHKDGIYIPDLHIMSILALLKSIHHKNHIEIVHPGHSMMRRGPQVMFTCTGAGKLNRFISKNIETGACVVWDELYTIHSNHLVGQSILSNTVDIDLPEIVTQRLLVDPLMGEKNERRLLGKLVFLLSPDLKMKTLLSLVFSLIPKEDELPDKNMYYSILSCLFDEIKLSVETYPEVREDDLRRFISIVIGANEEKKYINEIEEILIRMSFIEIPEENLTFLLDMIMILISCKHSEYFKEFKNEIVFPGSFTFD